MNCTCNGIYVKMLAAQEKPRQGHAIPFHEDRCISAAERALDIDLQVRIAYERVPDWKSCTNRMSHGPHGGCSGQSFDRT